MMKSSKSQFRAKKISTSFMKKQTVWTVRLTPDQWPSAMKIARGVSQYHGAAGQGAGFPWRRGNNKFQVHIDEALIIGDRKLKQHVPKSTEKLEVLVFKAADVRPNKQKGKGVSTMQKRSWWRNIGETRQEMLQAQSCS